MDWSIKQGAKITELRVKKGFTQDYVAKKIGVHPMTISQWERGKHSPSPHRIRDLAFLYNVTVEEIADDVEPEPAPIWKSTDQAFHASQPTTTERLVSLLAEMSGKSEQQIIESAVLNYAMIFPWTNFHCSEP